MKDFRLAIVAVICADTPKSAIKKNEKHLENWENVILKATWEEALIIIIFIKLILQK